MASVCSGATDELMDVERRISECSEEYERLRMSLVDGVVTSDGQRVRERMDWLLSEMQRLRRAREDLISLSIWNARECAANAQCPVKRNAPGGSRPCAERDESARKRARKQTPLITPAQEQSRIADVFHRVAVSEAKSEENTGAKDAQSGQEAEKSESAEPWPEENTTTCDECGGILRDHGWLLVCHSCGVCCEQPPNCDAQHTSFGNMNREWRSGGGYRPLNHFCEIIMQFQGKRRSSAPDEIYELIRKDCERYHLERSQITPSVIRHYLKQRGLNMHYKHCAELSYRLSGIPPPYMTPMQEERIMKLYPLVVAAYQTSPRYLERMVRRNGRMKVNPNNMNCFYVFYKLCQLLGYTEFLPYIPLPKSQAGIDDNDENGWRHICKVHGWKYMPTR